MRLPLATEAASPAATLQARVKSPASVVDYGAIGNGTADDTAAIQKAINSNPGKGIYFPAWTYLISAKPVIVSNKTILMGVGRDLSTITRAKDFSSNTYGNNSWFDYSNGIVIGNNNASAYARDLNFSDLAIYGYNGFGTNAIILNGANIEDITFNHSRFLDFGACAIGYETGRNVRFNDISIKQCNPKNIPLTACMHANYNKGTTNPSTHFKIINCSSGWNLDGTQAKTTKGIIIGSNCDYYIVKDNNFTGNRSPGLSNDSSRSSSKIISDNFGL
jgi:hypothetical protein